ncbi:MAG: TolC family protein [Gemmatimonadota bacterium]
MRSRCALAARRRSLGRALAALLFLLTPVVAAAPRPLTLREAIDRALARSPSLAVSRADSAVARALLAQAAALPNPTVAVSYSRSPPQYHLELEQPLSLPWSRSARVRAAREGALAAAQRLEWDRARLARDVEVLYAATCRPVPPGTPWSWCASPSGGGTPATLLSWRSPWPGWRRGRC